MHEDITVIIPIYNVEKYISKCLDSLLNQTYQNFRILAVNDGSPDNSADIVRSYEKTNNRIELLDKKNGGYGSVLEEAIKQIKTKYFLICDPDDWLSSNSLEELHNIANNTDADIVVGDKYYVYENTKDMEYAKVYPDFLNIVPGKVYIYPKEIRRFAFGSVSPHAKLYKTKICKNIKFPHGVSYTDQLLYIVSLSYAKKITYINKPLAYYLTDREGNTVTDKSVKALDDTITVWKSISTQIGKNTDDNILYFWIYVQFKNILNLYATYEKNQITRKQEESIESCLDILDKYRSNIIKGIKDSNIETEHSVYKSLLLKGILNPVLKHSCIKIFIAIKRKRWKVSQKKIV